MLTSGRWAWYRAQTAALLAACQEKVKMLNWDLRLWKMKELTARLLGSMVSASLKFCSAFFHCDWKMFTNPLQQQPNIVHVRYCHKHCSFPPIAVSQGTLAWVSVSNGFH